MFRDIGEIKQTKKQKNSRSAQNPNDCFDENKKVNYRQISANSLMFILSPVYVLYRHICNELCSRCAPSWGSTSTPKLGIYSTPTRAFGGMSALVALFENMQLKSCRNISFGRHKYVSFPFCIFVCVCAVWMLWKECFAFGLIWWLWMMQEQHTPNTVPFRWNGEHCSLWMFDTTQFISICDMFVYSYICGLCGVFARVACSLSSIQRSAQHNGRNGKAMSNYIWIVCFGGARRGLYIYIRVKSQSSEMGIWDISGNLHLNV